MQGLEQGLREAVFSCSQAWRDVRQSQQEGLRIRRLGFRLLQRRQAEHILVRLQRQEDRNDSQLEGSEQGAQQEADSGDHRAEEAVQGDAWQGSERTEGERPRVASTEDRRL